MRERADRAEAVRIIRSKRRKKTVSVRQVGDALEVRAPADISDEELHPIIDRLQKRIERRQKRHVVSDEQLWERAKQLDRKYFGHELPLRSIRYVTNQQKRFGSCSTRSGDIRLSDRLRQYPTWVLDYVIVHELAHLVHSDHSSDFWELVNRYPLTERARGFLIAVDLEDDGEE